VTLPTTDSNPRLIARCKTAARAAAALLMLVGALVFVGWAIDSPTLNQMLAGRFIMHLNTGLAFVISGAALIGISTGYARRVIAIGCGLTVFAIGSAVTLSHVLEQSPVARGTRMELETSICMIISGVAIALLAGNGKWSRLGAHAIAASAILVALAALFGHAYSAKFMFGIAAYTTMSVTTGLCFIVLGFGLLLVRPDGGLMTVITSDGPAGFLARRLYPAVVAIPLVLGALTLAGEQARLFNGKFGLSLVVLATVVLSVGLVWLTSRSFARADTARQRLAAVLLEESGRRHIARELHDEVGQYLTALKARLEVLSHSGSDVKAAQELLQTVMKQVSNLSLDLRPAMLDDLGLLPALLWLFERYTAQTGVQVEFAHEGIDRRFGRDAETAAFRIVQEALSNAAKHAGAKSVQVRVWAKDELVFVQLVDAGKGFDPSAVLASPSTSGLLGMRERAAALGGRFEIESAPGQGVRLYAELPGGTA
jgi:signal transduction histidine kinase